MPLQIQIIQRAIATLLIYLKMWTTCCLKSACVSCAPAHPQSQAPQARLLCDTMPPIQPAVTIDCCRIHSTQHCGLREFRKQTCQNISAASNVQSPPGARAKTASCASECGQCAASRCPSCVSCASCASTTTPASDAPHLCQTVSFPLKLLTRKMAALCSDHAPRTHEDNPLKMCQSQRQLVRLYCFANTTVVLHLYDATRRDEEARLRQTRKSSTLALRTHG